MSAYIIARVEITDMDQYRKYMERTPDLVAEFGGRFLVRGGETVTLEGPQEDRRVVLLEFPSLDQARAFFDSPGYARAKELRVGAATASFIAVAGV